MGRQVLSTVLKSNSLDIQSVQSGVYLLDVSIADKRSTIKLMIQ